MALSNARSYPRWVSINFNRPYGIRSSIPLVTNYRVNVDFNAILSEAEIASSRRGSLYRMSHLT